jgi:hypothetical protein
MQLTTTGAKKICTKLGLRALPSSHHMKAYLEVDGKVILTVHYSFGKKDIPEPIAHKFRGQLRLSLNQFEEMRKCRIGRKEYVDILRRKGEIKT